ncbi:MAG: efflux RND transporter periplasmic adaptor subunit [marine benthic group bacterium]|jgi:HlyD family secretion protein|nr:efflux RND transporter periplasmic adaptor subunit [Candidatus Carthagonibacter metallireducens]MCL7964760.1 efflux RND transporter periplasmic adaptor subunit [Gemmatimonadota bacterium]MCL7967565.1 efflux RND transporter periplasmic adaptor subunit [Gemmatimonadota bacterium]MCL7975766.1 efflux RND transporter periplasmic adaptor subunit [Gemmatimonadota bacterium]MCL7980103.1 efflux RND transporter periplasmic adaptor subunit [Gemmatimonadota bacterium]
MSRGKKILIGVGVAAVLVIMAIAALRGGRSDAVEVRVEEVGRRNLVARVSATGYIEPQRLVDISADVSGRVVELNVEEGDEVEEGDLLLVIDPARFEAAVDRAEAGLAEASAREAQARGNYLQAQRDWERIRDLKGRLPEMVTDSEFETMRTTAEVQEALWESGRHAVEMARAGLKEARDNLAKTVIRAPMSGRVTRLNVEKGETAIVGTMNNPGSLLITVADLSVMEAVIEVDETDVPDITIGDSVSVTVDAFPDREFVGRVTKIGNSSIRPRSQQVSSSDQAIDFEIRVTLEDAEVELRPDLSASADVITDVRPDAMAIPIIALTLMDPGEFEKMPNELEGESASAESEDPDEPIEGVFVVADGLARFRPVEVGVAGDAYFEVLSGLEEGETIVSGTYQVIRDLNDGDAVQVSEADSARADSE